MRRFFTAILLLFTLSLHAQKQYKPLIDSLLYRLNSDSYRNREDSEKVKLLDHLSFQYRFVDPDEGIRYAAEAIKLATQLNWQKGIAIANSAMAFNYQYRSDYVQAYEYEMRALRMFEEMGDKRQMANSFRNIASTYQYEKNYDKVLEYNTKALKLFEDLKDSSGIASTLSNIGIYYFYQNDFDKALEYDLRSLAVWEQLHWIDNIPSTLGNIGDVYLHKKEYAKALEYDLRSLDMFRRMGDKYGSAIDNGNIGEVYVGIARDTSANITHSVLIPSGKAACLDKAIEYLNKAIEESKEIDQLENIIEFSQYLSDAYMMKGDYKAALESYKQYAINKDSVYSISKAAQIKQTEHAHDLELKDRDIKIARLAVAKKQNEQTFFIAGIVLLLLVIGIVLRNYNTQKRTNTLLSSEKKRSDDLLLNILPAEVATELKEKGTSTAKYFDNVTVMFTDFVDFTGAGMRMSPQQLVDELHTCFKTFDEIVRKHGIEKIKTVGDAYLAVSGLPLPDAKHAEKIVKAALEIRDFMQERKSQMGDRTFDVRIGIHSGNVVAGIVGVIKFAYDIWRDTVNTAARMEEHSAAGKINISETTYDLVKDKFTCEYRGEIEAKNKGMMKMYFVS